MQILFVLGILMLNTLIISNINTTYEAKVKSDVLNREMYEKTELALSIAPVVRIAYDLGQQSAGCPGTSVEIGLNPNIFKLCWTGLDANRCFSPDQMRGNKICLANAQSLAFINHKVNPLALIVSKANAFGGVVDEEFFTPGPAPEPEIAPLNPLEAAVDRSTFNQTGALSYVPMRSYTKGVYVAKPNTTPIVAAGLSQTVPGARVIIPPNFGGNGVTDFVNCQTNHTECFNVSFCVNGSPNCTGKQKITQTFAVRHY